MRVPPPHDARRRDVRRRFCVAVSLVVAVAMPIGSAAAWLRQAPPADTAADRERQVGTLLRYADRVRRTGDVERALGLYSLALRTDPASRLALYNIGILEENAGRPQAAARIWLQAMEADQANLFAYEHLVRNLAAGGALEDLIAVERRVLEERPDVVRRLRLAMALQAAGRATESLPHLERVLMERPSSNIAYTFLKDGFSTREQWLGYVEEVGRRAAAAGSPVELRLLHIRLLLERGQVAEAARRAPPVAAESDLARTLLAGAGLVRADAVPPARPEGTRPPTERAERRPEDVAVDTEQHPTGITPPDSAGGEVALSPAPPPATPPDFGSDDPRSVPLYVERGRAALAEQADAEAERELRRALDASPLALQPRMTLSLLLDQQGRGIEAREILQGPVEPAPWDFYQHVWRTVRDEFVDPDHNGIDVYRWRQQARERVRSLDDARVEINALLDALGDRWGRLFRPETFARYLLAPNARPPVSSSASAPPAVRSGIDLPEEAFGIEETVAMSAGPENPSPAATPTPEASPSAGDVTAPPKTEELGEPPARPAARPPAEPEETDPSEAAPHRRRAQLRLKEPEPPATDAGAHYARDPRVRSAQFTLASLVGPTVPEPEARVGYLSVPSLAGLDVARQVARGLATMSDVVLVIIDLRGNRGGDAFHAIAVAAELLPAGSRVATYLTRRGAQLQTTSLEGEHRPAAPLLVLVNRNTASAAEMLAAALRDEGSALLVGERTAGKGVGQKAVLLPDGSGLSLTRFELRSPAGERWDGQGLQPDVLAEGATETDVIRLAVQEQLRRQGILPR